MDFLQLQTFKAIVDEGSVLGAAEALHCVQSNVTARIRSLEHTVGVKLFHRQGRRLQLTPSGRTLLGYADRILALSREASAALNPSGEPSGDFSLGAIESSATSRLPAVLARFHAAFPKVRLNLVTDTSLNLLDEIQHGRVDAALIAGTACLEAQAQAFVVADEIYREPIVLVAPARADTVHEAADLAGATLLMWPPGCPYRATMEQWLAANTVTPGRILSYGSYATIVACVGAGVGYSLVPRGVYLRYRQEAAIVGHALDDLAAVPNFFVRHRGVDVHPAREAFLKVMREYVSEAQEAQVV
ncbi:LysR family transcriptional regulator [Pandoraea sp. PE-S2R-1]|uniref:LysR family transcriptional regulator n=1 Tax=Pandoraea sp. PE-S2R-1 TaxID=1986994 RepID=UPI001482C35F|nr:LysR family transcriptional regulator [Pandoraea sp. PE-S2R-1]